MSVHLAGLATKHATYPTQNHQGMLLAYCFIAGAFVLIGLALVLIDSEKKDEKRSWFYSEWWLIWDEHRKHSHRNHTK